MDKTLTIITPVYNRKDIICQLYNSLCVQSSNDFHWLIIDDGSSDGLKEIWTSLFDSKRISVEYHYKSNGGKHTALNYAHQFVSTELVCFVDSDDYLTPVAVDEILETWKCYQDNPDICGISYLRGYSDGRSISPHFPQSPWVSNHFERINHKITGDCFEIIRTELFLKYPFPTFSNEKFMGEGYLWNCLARNHQTVYINKVIYICEYLDGGLSKSGKAMRIKNPLGGMVNSEQFFYRDKTHRYHPSIVMKKALLFNCYACFAGMNLKERLEYTNHRALIITYSAPGYLMYVYWRAKYGE